MFGVSGNISNNTLTLHSITSRFATSSHSFKDLVYRRPPLRQLQIFLFLPTHSSFFVGVFFLLFHYSSSFCLYLTPSFVLFVHFASHDYQPAAILQGTQLCAVIILHADALKCIAWNCSALRCRVQVSPLFAGRCLVVLVDGKYDWNRHFIISE